MKEARNLLPSCKRRALRKEFGETRLPSSRKKHVLEVTLGNHGKNFLIPVKCSGDTLYFCSVNGALPVVCAVSGIRWPFQDKLQL